MPAVTKKRGGVAAARNLKMPKGLFLPTEANRPPEDLADYIVMIYGRKGIGKTTLANGFPNALTFMTERYRRNLPINMVPALSWEHLVGYQDLFLDSDDYDTAVLDTVDRVYLSCFEWVCDQAGVQHPGDARGPEVWDEIKIQFDAFIAGFAESEKSLVMLSHEKDRPVNVPRKGFSRLNEDDKIEMGTQNRMEPSLRPQGLGVVQEMADFVLYYCFIDGVRCMYIRSPNEVAWTSCGTNNFLDPDGTPLCRFEVGNNAAECYDRLTAAFNNEVRDVDYQPPREKKSFKKK